MAGRTGGTFSDTNGTPLNSSSSGTVEETPPPGLVFSADIPSPSPFISISHRNWLQMSSSCVL